MDSIERLLAQIKTECEESANQQPMPVESIKQPPLKSTALIDSLLEQVKADYQQKDQAEAEPKQQELAFEQLKQQQLERQTREVLKIQAIAWLKKLDPLSSEGIWFEKFAEKYASKVEAAIDYFQAIEQTDK